MKKTTFTLIIILWLIIGLLSACNKIKKECWECELSSNGGGKVTVCQADMPTTTQDGFHSVKNCKK